MERPNPRRPPKATRTAISREQESVGELTRHLILIALVILAIVSVIWR